MVDEDLIPTMDEIENDLARWLIAKVDKPLEADGWFTAGKMAEKAHTSYDRANHVLNNGVIAGEIELKEYGSSKYYRLKKG